MYDREEVYNSDTVQPLRVINATGSEPMPGGMTIGISSLAVDRYDKDSPMVLVGLLHAGCRIVNAETGEVIDTSVKPSAEAASVASVAIQSVSNALSSSLIHRRPFSLGVSVAASYTVTAETGYQAGH